MLYLAKKKVHSDKYNKELKLIKIWISEIK